MSESFGSGDLKNNLTLGDFKNAVGMGTRPNRYLVNMPIPNSNYTMDIQVSSLSIPGAQLGTIYVPFRGRTLKLPGDRRFNPWSFTVYDTTDGLWNTLHNWSNNINNYRSNETKYTSEDGVYNSNWTIAHYDLNGDKLLKKVRLYNCWLSNVSPFELAYGSIDQMSQFSCTVEYEFFEHLI